MPKRKTPKDTRPRDLVQSGNLCVAFANTAASRPDHRYRVSKPPPGTTPVAFKSYDELLSWCLSMQAFDAGAAGALQRTAAKHPADAAAVTARAVELRDALFRMFTTLANGHSPALGDLDVLNRRLAVTHGRRVIPDGGGSFRLAWGGDGTALEAVLAPIVWSAADFLASDDLQRLQRCVGRDCARLFVAHTARRRLYCDPNRCASRERSRHAYRRWRRNR